MSILVDEINKEALPKYVIKVGDMYVYLLLARNFFYDSTVLVVDWLKKAEDDGNGLSYKNINRRMTLLIEAIAAVSKHSCFDIKELYNDMPRIGYNTLQDADYFIFKTQDNGNTFIVTEYLMPELNELVPG